MGTLNRKIARRYGKAIDLDNFKADGSLETGAPTIYDSAGLLPTSGVANGTQAYVTANQKLYIRATGGWYNVATVNTTPTINSVADAGGDSSPFSLAKDGSTTTVITITATDSEGFPLTFSAVANSGFNGLATVAQDSSVFTITPKTEAAATTTEGTLTFRASDGVNIASEIATFTLVFKITDSRFTTTLIKASGNNGTNTAGLTDASSNNATITTPSNSPTNHALSPYHPGGYSTSFNGSNSHIDVASSADFAFGSNDFTIEFWAYPKAVTIAAILDPRTTDSQAVPWIGLRDTGYWYYYVSGANRILGTADSVTADQWYHVAICRSSGTTKMFVNGRQDGSSYTDNTSYVQGGVWRTGTRYSGDTLGFNGYIRDFRCINGTALYTADFAVPTSPLTAVANTKLLHSHLPCIADGSSSKHTITQDNMAVARVGPYDHSPYASGFADHGSSALIESKQYYVSVPSWKGGTTSYSGEFTYEGWFYFTETDGFQNNVILSEHPSSGNRGLLWYNNTYYAVLASSTSGWSAAGGVSFGSIGKGWHHIALVRDGDVLRPFVNGKQGTTTTLSSGAALNFPDYATLIGTGYEGWESTDAFYLGEFRIVWGSAVYTSDFTVPTEPLSAITNTVRLVRPAAPNIFDQSGDAAEIVLVGDAKSSTAQTKNASASMYFDGTGDAVRVGSTRGTADSYDLDQFAFSDEPLAIEFWMRPGAATKQTVVSWIKYNSSGGRNTPHFYMENDGTLKYWRNASIIASTSALSANTWYHVSYNRFGGRDAFYLNGTSVGTSTIGNTAYEQGRMAIGQYLTTSNGLYSSDYYNGYIEDIRVTKGKIRNVMPTAETFTSDSNTTFLTAHTTTITDGSSNNHTITTNGSPTVSNFGPAAGMKSIYFDGTDDYLSMGTGLFGSGDFTIEFWWHPSEDGDSYTSSSGTVTSHTFIDSRGGTRLQLWHNFSSSSSAAANSTGGYTASYYGNANSLYWTHVEDRWTHYAYQRTSGTLRCYVNGIDQGWTTTNNNDASANTTYIGCRHDNQATRLKGHISNFRISNIARYTGNFTAPTTELEA